MLRRQCINLKLMVKLIVVNLVFPVVRTRGRGSADVPFKENVPGVGWHAAEPQKSRTGSTNTYGINRYMLTWGTMTSLIRTMEREITDNFW